MSQEEIIEKLTPVFRSVFRDENLQVTRELSAEKVERWDSLSNTIMIDAVEKAFAIRFSFRDIVNMKNVGDMIDLISKYIS